MRVNTGPPPVTEVTHGGVPAKHITPEQQLRRTIMTCMLWEDTFYESGKSVVERLRELVPQVAGDRVAAMALEARSGMKLRHAPLLLVREMARYAPHRKFVRAALAAVIQRPDELAEFLALYWQSETKPCACAKTPLTHLYARGRTKPAKCKLCKGAGTVVTTVKQPLAKSVQRGLADAFLKFNAYELAKYNRDNPVKLRDVMFLAHVKPTDGTRGYTRAIRKKLGPPSDLKPGEILLKQLTDNALPIPDTWEVALSGGADKKEAFTRLLVERKLGALALIRNLRNMTQAGVADALISQSLLGMNPERVLPFRFLAALKHAPRFASELEAAMLKNLEGQSKLEGRTILMVDVSGSMDAPISSKSDLQRVDAAAGLAILARELCRSVRVLTFSDKLVEVPAYRGLALADAITKSQHHSGTALAGAVTRVNQDDFNRLIIITDEQATDAKVPGPKLNGFMINVASYQNGVGYGAWHHIDGWSEKVLDYIREVEVERTGKKE